VLQLPPIPLNLCTAEPILRLLVALRGHDQEHFSVLGAWEAFKLFGEIETTLEDGGATFQVYPAEASSSQFEVFFGRQLTGPTEPGYRLSRMVGVHVLLETSEREVDPEELWSHDLSDRAAFFSRVEGLEQLAIAARAPLMMVTFVVEEELPEEA